MTYPTTFRGVLVVLTLLVAVVIVVYASTLAAAGVGIVLAAVAAYLLYIAGYRIDSYLKNRA